MTTNDLAIEEAKLLREVAALSPDARELYHRLIAFGDEQCRRMEARARIERLRDYADAQDL